MTGSKVTVGLLHPGDMGSMVGACAVAAGSRVRWASGGRSAGTRQRAAAAGLEDAGSLDALVAGSDVIISVCPPHAALDLARDVAARRFTGLFVDANAVACPANWRPGDDVIVPPPVTAKDAQSRVEDKALKVTDWYFSKKKI